MLALAGRPLQRRRSRHDGPRAPARSHRSGRAL